METIDKQVFEPAERLIRFFGTQDKTASALGVKQSTVNGWLKGKLNKGGHGISSLNAQKAEKLTNGEVRAIDLCPELEELEWY